MVPFGRWKFLSPALCVGIAACLIGNATAENRLSVGASVVDVTPRKLPISVTGSIAVKYADRVIDRLSVRSLVVGDSHRWVALCVVDNCTLPQSMVDSAIEKIVGQTDLKTSGIIIAATHTHSAPAVMNLHGNDRDDDYAAFLETSIVKCIVSAFNAQQPAQVGFATVELPQWTHVRRWLMKDGTATGFPFTGRDGNRVQFNPGHQNVNKIRPVGKPDPRLTLLAFQTLDGRPLAAMTNYNTHYAGAPQISSDYFGVVGRGLGKAIGADDNFVALASNGNSGNINCIDFTKPERIPFTHHDVGRDVIAAAAKAYQSIETFRSDAVVQSSLSTVRLQIRKGSDSEVERARRVTAAWIDERGPKGWEESYARETIKLTEYPDQIELPLRSVRIGDFAIGSIPCEVYAQTGMSIKDHSPFAETIVMGWAGGYWGYLPTPSAFRLGGYTTWRCRSSCLDVMAEPKIAAEIDQQLLELSRHREPLAAVEPLDGNSIVVANGLSIHRVASEPQIVDPIAARFDRDGRMWVVEMRDYPVPIPGQDPTGRIRVLTDSDADGIYETAVTYIDGLDFPTGIQPWRDGVIVTLAGRVEWMRDRDHDGRCDQREVWIEGLNQGNEQLRANHPTLAADGWVYVANGLRGGTVRGVGEQWRDQPEVKLDGCNLAIHPKQKRFKKVAGNSQYGLSIDEFGRRLGVSNRKPIQSAAWSLSLLKHDPWNGPASAVSLLASSGTDSKVRPLMATSTTSHLHAGQYSAACGVHEIDSIAMEGWNGSVLVCEPTGYLVQRLRPAKKTAVIGERAFEPVFDPGEAIASTDRWFRPVDAVGGPGGVYVVDMQRQILEHPQWMPKELQARDDFKVGSDRGRIYRIQQNEHDPSDYDIDWSDDSPSGWIERLNHADRWVRSEAVRQWLEQDSLPDQWPEWLFRESHRTATQAIVLQWLAANNLLSNQHVELAAGSPEARLRQLVASIADPIQHSRTLITLLADSDPTVRRSAIETAFRSTTAWPPSLGDAVAEATLAVYSGGSSLPSLATESIENQRELAGAVVERTGNANVEELVFEVARLRAFRSEDVDLGDSLQIDTKDESALTRALTIVAATIQADRLSGRSRFDIKSLDPAVIKELDRVARPLAEMDSNVGQHALTWITHRPNRHLEWLRGVRETGRGPAFSAAVRSLAKADATEHVEWCQANATSLAYGELQSVVDAAIRSDRGRRWFVESIDSGKLPTMMASDVRWKQVSQSDDTEVVEAAKRIQAGLRDQRQKRLTKFVSAIDQPGDLNSGRELFGKHCAACHVMEGVGSLVGPDISDSRSKDKRGLLEAVIDPSAAIDAGFVGYQVLTSDGEVVQGLVVSQTEQTITLRISGGKERSFAVDELDVSQILTRSLMPDGFDTAMSPAQMNDLLHYLKHWRGDTYTQ